MTPSAKSNFTSRTTRAQVMRENGASPMQIAEALGVSKSTVYRLLNPEYAERNREGSRRWKRENKGACAECGAPTDVSNGKDKAAKHCAPCRRQHQHEERYWTAERIVAAIRQFAAEHGRPPRAADFAPALARSKRKYGPIHEGRFPHPTDAVTREFGSWNAAIEAAGFRPFDPTQDHDWAPGRPSAYLRGAAS